MNGGRVFTVPVVVLTSRSPPASRMSWATCSARVALAETTLIFILWSGEIHWQTGLAVPPKVLCMLSRDSVVVNVGISTDSGANGI